MEQILKRRNELISEYNRLIAKEQAMERQVQENKRALDIFLEVDRVHFQFSKDRIVASLFETQKRLFEEAERLSKLIYETLKNKEANKEDVVDAGNKKEHYIKLNERIKSVVGYNETDIYEMSLAIREIDNMLCLNEENFLRESLMNFKILRDVAKIYTFQEENELFELAQNIIKSLVEKLDAVNKSEEVVSSKQY